jgi:PKD repeat protein
MRILPFIIFCLICLPIFAQSPTANFTASPLSACAGVPINFTNTSITNGGPAIVSSAWDFGDGNAATTSNAIHSYTLAGTYTVTLVVTNASGNVDAEIKGGYITILPAPTVGFGITGAGCTIPLTLTFTNQSSQGANYTYNWNFGNGQTSTLASPPSITYNTAGTYNIGLTVTNTSNGCSAAFADEIAVSNFQTGITAPLTACAGQTIFFNDNSTAGANAWNWNFGGQGSSTQQNPSFTFPGPGVYNVQLTSQNTLSGCSGSAVQQITVQGAITPSFSASPLINCAPASINFVNTTGLAGTYTWNFGNGQTYTGQTPPAQIYTYGGQFDVTLSLTTAAGCIGTTTLNDYITISNITAGFTAATHNGCDPLNVQFVDSSSTPNPANTIVNWQWNFGNGQTYSGQNPPAQIYPIGLFDVTLIVTSQSGCIDTAFFNDYVTVGHIDSVGFTVLPIVSCARTDVDFTNTSVIIAPHLPNEVTYFWDFMEGTSTQENPSHQFTSDTGYFSVTLVVDFRGCKDSITIDSAVYILAPIAKFSPSTQLICNPTSFPVNVNFTDNAIHGELPDNVNMTWEWGDGTPNTNIGNAILDSPNNGNSSHNFSSYGSYTVEQVVRNFTTGCKDSITKQINISQLVSQFTMSNDSVCKNDSLFLFNNSTTWSTLPNPHPIVEWIYTMGNGQVVNNGQNPSYAYSTSGNYTVSLIVTNSVGCTATSVLPIKVLNNPFGILSAANTVGCSPFLVNFTNNSTSIGNGSPLASFTTTFSDDSSTLITNSINSPIFHTFNGTGTYYATMVVTDQFGCESVPANVPITITKPNAFYTVPNVLCNNDTIQAINSSTGVGTLSYQWSLNANPISTDTNASVNISVPNPVGLSTPFVLTLIVADSNGCMDTLIQTINLSTPQAIPSYAFSGAVLNNNGEYDCPPLFCTFTDASQSYGSIAAWNWIFGNGNTSILENPSNTLVTNGSFDLTLSITDQYGCTDDTTILNYVTIGGPAGNPDWIQNISICAQGAGFLISNALNIDSVLWDMGDGTYQYNSLNFQYNYENPGTYAPSCTIINSDGCEIFYQLDTISVVDDGLDALFTALPNPADINEVVNYTDQSTFNGSGIVSWTWDLGNDSLFILPNNASQSAFYSLGGAYPITLTIIDGFGCSDTYVIIVNVNDPDIWVPNVFTPNNDQTNDFLTLPFPAFKFYNFELYNRWGNSVVLLENQVGTQLQLWNGLDEGGDPYNDGVYFYHLTGEMLGGTIIDKHGFVTLIGSK